MTVTKEKEKEKRKERGKGKEKEEKAIVAPLVCIIATLKIVLAEKNCSTQKVYLEIMLSNIRLDDPTKYAAEFNRNNHPAKQTALMPNGLKPRLPHATVCHMQPSATCNRLPHANGTL